MSGSLVSSIPATVLTSPGPSSLFEGAPAWFTILFAIVGAIVAVGFVFVAYSIVRRNARLREHGHDPMHVEADVADRLATGRIADAGDRSVEARLAEIDDLAARGVISPEEQQRARDAALGGDR